MSGSALDSLGPYPILQFAFALAVLGGATWAAWRGFITRSETQTPSRPAAGGVEVYLDGPFGQNAVKIDRLSAAMERLAAAVEEACRRVPDLDEISRRISVAKHDVRNELGAVVKGIERDTEGLETRLREIERLAAAQSAILNLRDQQGPSRRGG